MLELGLTKLTLIALVAFIVIGPARLPRVARTVGMLLGRAQRYLNEVKNEVSREIELEELREMKMEFEQSARHIEQTIHHHLGEPDIAQPFIQSARHVDTPCKRRAWRVRRNTLPLWYKRIAARNRTHVQSGAARMSRYGLIRRQKPIRFF